MFTRLSKILSLLVIVGVCGPQDPAAAQMDPQRFAVGWPIEIDPQQAFFDVPLSLEVYERAQHVDGLAVLDQNLEAMPFYLITAPAPTVTELRTILGVSPLYRSQVGSASAELSVDTSEQRTSVTVTRSPTGATSDIVAFVVDASNTDDVAVALDLEWRALDRPFLMNVSIEHSESLTAWRTVGRDPVAALLIDGAQILHQRVEISATQGGYYRVNWDRRRVSDWTLERVTLISSSLDEATSYAEVDLTPLPDRPQQALVNALYFDALGELPTAAASLEFGAANRWANADVGVSNAIDGPWRLVAGQRLFYDIDFEGQAFTSAPLEFALLHARYWRVTFDREPEANGVTLRLRYPQETLRVAANGEPPYMLVGGTLLEEAGADANFAAVWNQLGADQAPPARARLLTRVELGGAAAFDTPFEMPLRTILLWLALIAGVLVVAFMALKLLREMSVQS